MRGRTPLLLLGLLAAVAVLAAALVWLWQGRPARLTVRTVPPGVSVSVDGEPAGVTSDTGLVVTIREAGPHGLRLEKAGYAADTSTVALRAGEAVELEVVMQVPGMAFIRGGTFRMGDPEGDYNERPAREVTVRPFYLDRTEVTVGAFRAFLPDYRPPFPGDAMPASGVPWEQADAYCRQMGKRLPTEAEWERACTGVRGTRYSYGDAYDASRARTGAGLKAGPVPVGSYRAGNAGLMDMTGNVWEWCADWYGRDSYRSGPADNPTGPARGRQRVLRGGAWYSNARYARCAHRPGEVKMAWHTSFGFRCARDLQ